MDTRLPIPKQATAQRRLLAELRSGAGSATDLARRSGIGRTSVSRALRALERRALVAKGPKRRWSLTVEGQKASGRLPAGYGSLYALTAILSAQQRTQQTVGRAFAAQALTPLVPSWRKGVEQNYRLATNATSIARIADSALARTSTIQSMPGTSKYVNALMQDSASMDGFRATFDFTRKLDHYMKAGLLPDEMAMRDTLRDAFQPAVGGAIASIFAAQRVQMDALSAGLVTRAWWASGVAESMVPTTRIASDLAGLSSILGSRRAVVTKYGEQFGAASDSIVGAYARNVADFLTRLAPAPPEAPFTTADVMLYGTTTAAFVSGVRGLLAPPEDQEAPAWEPLADSGIQDLANRLELIDPALAEMYLGAWDAVRSAGPDWSRHLSQSGREVLRQLIARLAPRDDVLAKYGVVTRKTAVKYVVAASGETATAYAIASAEHVFETLNTLSAEAKHDGRSRFNRQGSIGVLESLGGLIRILLTYADIDGREGGG